MAGSTGIAVVVAAGLSADVALVVLFSVFSLAPQKVTVVVIPHGASIESNYEPAFVRVTIGVNNTIRWINQDSVPHGVRSDEGYADPLTGAQFDSYAGSREGKPDFLLAGETFEFTFREPGEYHYHMEPHPWMQGTVLVRAP